MLYVEPTTKAGAAALASAVKRAGNVVVAAQLTAGATSEDAVEWLRPLQDIESSAAGVGHVDVHTGFAHNPGAEDNVYPERKNVVRFSVGRTF